VPCRNVLETATMKVPEMGPEAEFRWGWGKGCSHILLLKYSFNGTDDFDFSDRLYTGLNSGMTFCMGRMGNYKSRTDFEVSAELDSAP